MKTLGIIILLIVITLTVVRGYQRSTPELLLKYANKDLADTQELMNKPLWYYYTVYAFGQIINLGIIGYIIYALTQL